MHRRTVLLSLPALFACTPTRRPPGQGTARQRSEPPAEARAEVRNRDFWKWDHAPEGEQTWGDSQARRTALVTSDGRYSLRTISVDDEEHFALVHTGPQDAVRWQTSLGKIFVPAGVLVSDGERIYVTHHCAIASGAEVSAIERATGRVVWTTALEGLGPVEHSKYRNETQIDLDERGLVIYGNEAQGQYTEVLDPQTGAQRSLAQPDPRLVELAWEGKGPGDPFHFERGPSTLTVGETRYVVTEPEDSGHPAVLERLDGTRTTWTTPLRSQGSCGKATMRVIDQTLWVAHYCAMSSGVELLVVEADSGRIARTVAVHGLGSIGHSEYFNEVELDERLGYVVVRGREAAGRYIEVIEPQTGLARVNLTFWG